MIDSLLQPIKKSPMSYAKVWADFLGAKIQKGPQNVMKKKQIFIDLSHTHSYVLCIVSR